MKLTASIMALFLSAAATVAAVASVPSDTVSYRMDLQRYLYPQEKVHVTTDQGRYVAGDTVWLRAFVVDAATHRPVSMSRYVYIELQDPMGRTETRIKLRHDSAGVFAGYLPLSEEMPEGDYTMHAYTAFMENQGREYFFTKRLPVPEIDTLSVAFFPEGGYLVAGCANRGGVTTSRLCCPG